MTIVVASEITMGKGGEGDRERSKQNLIADRGIGRLFNYFFVAFFFSFLFCQ